MRKRLTTSLAALAVLAAATGSLLVGLSGTAFAVSPAPWQATPPTQEVGTLTFYNSTGQEITGGNLTDNPIAAYIQGSVVLQTGATKATVNGYTPVSGEAPGQWSGENISGPPTTYPNSGAPTALASSALPLVTGSASGESLSSYISDYPNSDTSTTDGYGGVYELRLFTSNSGGTSTNYDAADIEVSGSTWSVVYPALSPIGTSTGLSENPTSPQQSGTSVQLNATVTPSTASGSVQFEYGPVATPTLIGSPVTVAGGAASISTSTLPVGTDTLSAVFTPSAPSGFLLGYATSTGTSSFVVTQAPATSTATALGVNPTTSAAFTTVDLTGTVTAGGSALASGTGSVNFYDNGTSTSGTISSTSTLLGSGPVGSGGVATLSYGSFGQGAHNIVAQFEPTSTATYDVSTSADVLYTATAPASTPAAQTLNVTIPAGAITITTPYTPTSPFNLGTATINSSDSAFQASAPFGNAQDPSGGVTITDTRADDQSWTASALDTNFTSSGGTINGQNLTFTGVTVVPFGGSALGSADVTTTDITNTAVYPAGATGNDGLGGTLPHAFASAQAGTPSTLTAVDGSVYVYGNLNLTAPTSTPAGLYTATLTFTVA